MSKIKMQYPYNSQVASMDGLVHDIRPTKMIRMDINGINYYFLEYFDYNLGHDMIAILTEYLGNLYNIPLTAYNLEELKSIINKYGQQEIDPLLILKEDRIIYLASTMSTLDLLATTIRDGKIVVDYPLFVVYNPANPMQLANRVFRSCCRFINGKTTDYIFDKEKNCVRLENKIRKEIKQNFFKAQSGEVFDVDIEVEIPVNTSVVVGREDGGQVNVDYIPGIHVRKVFLVPCVEKEKENGTRLCDRVSVLANFQKYHRYDQSHEAFRDAYEGELPLTFSGLPKDYSKSGIATIKVKNDLDVDPIEETKNWYLDSIEEYSKMTKAYDRDGRFLSSYKEKVKEEVFNRLLKNGLTKEKIDDLIKSW